MGTEIRMCNVQYAGVCNAQSAGVSNVLVRMQGSDVSYLLSARVSSLLLKVQEYIMHRL